MDLIPFLSDCVQKNSTTLITGEKTFADLKVNKITVKGQTLLPERDPCVIDEPVIFTKPLEIRHLIFEKKLNGIDASDFGKSFLLSETEQTFTAPQIIESAEFLENVHHKGFINNQNLTELFSNCYYTDRPEYIENVVFHFNVKSQAPVTLDGFINGIKPFDILLSKSNETQYVYGLKSDQHLKVTGEVFVTDTINGIKVAHLKDFTQSHTPQNLIINGTCYFEKEPHIEFLNNRNVTEYYQKSWLLNEDAIIDTPTYLADVVMQQDFNAYKNLNNYNYHYLMENYVSKTKSQTISAPIIVKGNLITNDVFAANDVHVEGLIKGLNR